MPSFLRNFIFQRMQKEAGDLAVPALTKSVGKLGPRDLPSRFTPTQPLRSFPGAPVQAPGLPKPPNVPAAAANASRPGWQGNVLGAATTAVGLLGDPFGITNALLQTAGKPDQSRMSLLGGGNTDPLIPTTTPMQRAQVGQPMVLGGRLGYKSADGSWQPRGDMESENIPQYLPGSPQADKSGYVWDAARQQASGNRPPVATPPAVGPQLSPEERAYNAERSRIAQLTEQNPEFQNIGQLRNDLRDQGMAIWAAKYGGPGGLASKVKPGAVGYDAIQRGIGIQAIPSLENRAEFGLDQLTQGPTPAVPMADEMLNPASPGFIGGEGAPPMNFADPRFENMSPEYFQKLLNQVNRK